MSGRRTLRERKVAQRIAVVDETTRKKASRGPLLLKCLSDQRPAAKQRTRIPLSKARTPERAHCGAQAAQERLDAYEADNEVDDTAAAGSDDDDFVLAGQDDEDGDDGALCSCALCGSHLRCSRSHALVDRPLTPAAASVTCGRGREPARLHGREGAPPGGFAGSGVTV